MKQVLIFVIASVTMVANINCMERDFNPKQDRREKFKKKEKSKKVEKDRNYSKSQSNPFIPSPESLNQNLGAKSCSPSKAQSASLTNMVPKPSSMKSSNIVELSSSDNILNDHKLNRKSNQQELSSSEEDVQHYVEEFEKESDDGIQFFIEEYNEEKELEKIRNELTAIALTTQQPTHNEE